MLVLFGSLDKVQPIKDRLIELGWVEATQLINNHIHASNARTAEQLEAVISEGKPIDLKAALEASQFTSWRGYQETVERTKEVHGTDKLFIHDDRISLFLPGFAEAVGLTGIITAHPTLTKFPLKFRCLIIAKKKDLGQIEDFVTQGQEGNVSLSD